MTRERFLDSEVISPMKQKTLDLDFFLFKDMAVPTATGIFPPTIAEEKILYFLNVKAMDFPFKIFLKEFF